MGRDRSIGIWPTVPLRQAVTGLPPPQRAGVDARQSTGRGEPGAVRAGLFNVTHQDLAVFQAGHSPSPSWKTAASFLRNTNLGGIRLDPVQDKSQRPRPSLEVVQDALAVAIFIVGRAGIGVRHA